VSISHPALRYTGSKWKIASWIMAQFPPHTAYVEPFCGGAAVLLRKPPSLFEVINDLNREVVNFFEVLRTRPAELVAAIDLTPYAREEHRQAYRKDETFDPLERARRFYVRSRQSFGTGEARWNTGWRTQHTNNRGKRIVDEWNHTDHLWAVARRLKEVMIECDDALKIFKRFDARETLFYVDPPYLAETRYQTEHYRHEMDDEDHRRLAETLQGLQGMVVVSGYPSPLYDDLYAGWRTLETSVQTNGKGSRVEKLWISPRIDRIDTLPLFRGG